MGHHRPADRAPVKRLNPRQHPGQGELFDQHRCRVVFTDSPFILQQAEAHHRRHAVIEQVNPDLIDGPWRIYPRADSPPTAPGKPAPPSHTTSPTAGHLAAPRYAAARAATIRTQINNVAARPAHKFPLVRTHVLVDTIKRSCRSDKILCSFGLAVGGNGYGSGGDAKYRHS